MANHNESHIKMAELLWADINNAILRSAEVKASIRRMVEMNMLDYLAKYNLTIDMKRLVELTNREEQKQEFKKAVGKTARKQAATSQRIDVVILTKNEILFRKFLVNQFDSKAWMKQQRINFQDPA